MCMCFVCVYGYTPRVCLVPVVIREGTSDGCELPRGCWESSPGSLKEQHVLLTTEPSLWPWKVPLYNKQYATETPNFWNTLLAG